MNQNQKIEDSIERVNDLIQLRIKSILDSLKEIDERIKKCIDDNQVDFNQLNFLENDVRKLSIYKIELENFYTQKRVLEYILKE
jgi:transcription termination factor NusB